MTRADCVALVTSAAQWRGSTASFVKIAEGLRAAGRRAIFVTGSGPMPDQLRDVGLDVEVLGAARTGLSELRALGAILRRHRVGVMYADRPRDIRLAALRGRMSGVPVAYRFNISASLPPGDLLTRLAARWTSAVVYLSGWSAARARDLAPWFGKRPTLLIPNGFDLEQYRRDPAPAAAIRERLHLPATGALVVYGAAFAQEKRHEFLLDVLEPLVRSGRPIVLALAGGTMAELRCAERARRSPVQVRTLGQLSADDFTSLLSVADVVAQPATENFGNVIGEAMACEAAVVVPDTGAAPEVIGPSGEAGLVVAADDALAWSTAIAALLDDPRRARHLGQRARQRIEREFPISKMQEAHLDLFDRLARGHAVGSSALALSR